MSREHICGIVVNLLMQHVLRLRKQSRTGRDDSERCLTVDGFWRDISGEGLASELGSECHLERRITCIKVECNRGSGEVYAWETAEGDVHVNSDRLADTIAG